RRSSPTWAASVSTPRTTISTTTARFRSSSPWAGCSARRWCATTAAWAATRCSGGATPTTSASRTASTPRARSSVWRRASPIPPGPAPARDDRAARARAHHLGRRPGVAQRAATERRRELLRHGTQHRRLGGVALARELRETRHRLADAGERRGRIAAIAGGEPLSHERLEAVDATGRARAEDDLQLADAREEGLERLGELDQVRVRGRRVVALVVHHRAGTLAAASARRKEDGFDHALRHHRPRRARRRSEATRG